MLWGQYSRAVHDFNGHEVNGIHGVNEENATTELSM